MGYAQVRLSPIKSERPSHVVLIVYSINHITSFYFLSLFLPFLVIPNFLLRQGYGGQVIWNPVKDMALFLHWIPAFAGMTRKGAE